MKDFIRRILYSNSLTASMCRRRAALIERFNKWKKYDWPIKKVRIFNPSTVFLVLTPHHDNIGDHAIAIAEREYFKKVNVKYYEITWEELALYAINDKLGVLNGSVIVAHGGGYLGTLWFSAEKLLRDLIKATPKSKIVLMPNTFFYENSEWGKKELENSIDIYNAHPNLHVFAREEDSYVLMKRVYKNVESVSDMVLSLHFPNKVCDPKGCLICFRNDREKTMSDDSRYKIIALAKTLFDIVDFTDMAGEEPISINERESAVMQKIEQFQKSELVITDRLHAMIFCAISETPCVVVNSKSHKVKGTYDKLKHLSYIRFADDIEDIERLIIDVTRAKDKNYDNSEILPEYDKIRKALEK